MNPMRKHALGIVIHNRWLETHKTLQSLFHSDQAKNSYDLYLIDNGCSPTVSAEIKEWVVNGLMPVKNVIKTKMLGIGAAWNLFLDITRNYPYRTKLDNDLIFANTPVALQPYEREKRNRSALPSDAGTNPGAIPVASFTMGAGKKVIRDNMKKHTCFLQYMEDAIAKDNLGMCSIPPVALGATLADTMPGLSQKTWRGHPCLIGACMTITKKCFDSIGYFDDSMPCYIDREYSQRAMGQAINVGYVDNYCVIHIGADNPTLSPSVVQENEWKMDRFGESLPVERGYVHSQWEKVHTKILKAAANNRIVNLV